MNRLAIHLAIVAIVVLPRLVFAAGISVTNSTTTRLVRVNLAPPEDALWVKLSHDPEFRSSSNGIAIQLASVDPNLEQAVVHITYPSGKHGGRGLRGGLPVGERHLKILGVLARLSDGGEIPPYATPAWLQQVMFSETEGVDARGVRNNVKAYWEQNTYGRVQISGDVYPEWVALKSSSNYVNLPSVFDTPTALMLDTITAIKEQSPTFFANEQYDFLVLLFPGDFGAVYNSFYEQSGNIWDDPNGIFRGYLIMDLPVEWSSKYFGAIRGERSTTLDRFQVRTRFQVGHVSGVFLATDTARTFDFMTNHDWFFFESPIRLDRPLPQDDSEVIVDYSTGYFTETNTALDRLHVDTSYSIVRVRGVWAATDTGRTGPNFFTGGSYSYRDNHITLGTALPGDNSVVVLDYETGAHFRFWAEEQPFFSAENVGGWYGTFLHELAHGFGPHITFTDSVYLGDLYQGADEIFSYGLMSGGNHLQWPLDSGVPHWETPGHLDAYTKYSLGLLLPYELRYGEDETNLTIYPAEEYPYTSRTKLIKVPLQPAGVMGYRRTDGYDYSGEEYLLLELRRRREVPGIYNFDIGIPHEGLLVYHVIERDPRMVGAPWQNMVKIIDATPPTPGDWFWNTNFSPRNLAQDSLYHTAAPFGPDSGVLRYVHGDFWQAIGNSNLLFRLGGIGQQTIYARFKNFGTNESPVYSTVVTLTPPGGADANTNGIADSWEQQNFGTTDIPGGANGDPDQDGATNLEEFLAGTNPTNAASRLIVSLRRNNGPELTFPTIRGRSYVVETARNLIHPRWYPLYSGSAIPGNDQMVVVSDYFSEVSERFYRVRLVPE